MGKVYVSWGVAAAVILLFSWWLGAKLGKGAFGILIDRRNRFSLAQFQLVAWTIVVVSLIIGVFAGRLIGDVDPAIEFTIPDELLVVMGISLGSAATSTAIKAGRDAEAAQNVAGTKVLERSSPDEAKFSDMFLVEEGTVENVVDVGKFQNFLFTGLLLGAYIALAIDHISTAATTADLKSLPTFPTTFVTLLGISHGGYVAGKLPRRA